MKTNKIEFLLEDTTGEFMECECCGSYCSSGTNIYVNGVLAWESYSDGHMYGDQTDKSIVDALIDTWFEVKLKQLHEQHTEESRIQYNIKYPGNGIANTPEKWKEYIQNHEQDRERISEYCVENHIPDESSFAIRFVALWIEYVTGEQIGFQVTHKYIGE